MSWSYAATTYCAACHTPGLWSNARSAICPRCGARIAYAVLPPDGIAVKVKAEAELSKRERAELARVRGVGA